MSTSFQGLHEVTSAPPSGAVRAAPVGGEGERRLRVACAEGGHGPQRPLHSLRHLFAVRCLQHAVPMAVVSQWMGHSDVNLTVKRYGRFAAEAKEQFAWINALGRPVEELAQARKPQLEVAR